MPDIDLNTRPVLSPLLAADHLAVLRGGQIYRAAASEVVFKNASGYIEGSLPSILGDNVGYVMFAPAPGTLPFGTNYDRFDIRLSPTTPITQIGNRHGGTGVARSLHFLAGSNVGLTVEINGNVGIGSAISGPSAALDVQRSGTNLSQIYVRNASVVATMWADSGSVVVGASTPTDLKFITNNTSRWLVDSTGGHLSPNVTNAYDLGNASQRVRNIYLNNLPITTSDERRKRWLGGMSEAEYAAGVQCFAELGFYQWNEKYEAEGEDARWHFGARAQRVWSIFAKHGLIDPIDANGQPGQTKYAFLCYDRWDDQWEPRYAEQEVVRTRMVHRASETLVSASGSPMLVEAEELYTEKENLPVLDDDGNQVMELVKAAGDAYGLRQSMFDSFLIAVLAEQNKRDRAEFNDRLAALEAA